MKTMTFKNKRYLKILIGLCLALLAFAGMYQINNESEQLLIFWVLFFSSVVGLFIAASAGLEKPN